MNEVLEAGENALQVTVSVDHDRETTTYKLDTTIFYTIIIYYYNNKKKRGGGVCDNIMLFINFILCETNT